MIKKLKFLFFITSLTVISSRMIHASFDKNLYIKQIINEKVNYSGPNCFNTALRALNLMEHKRYVHLHEMRSILRHQCVRLDRKEVGSLGLIEMKNNGLPMHAFIPLSNEEVFTKNGASKREVPKISSFSLMMNIHEKAIQFYCIKEGLSECEFKIQYYDCSSLNVVLPHLESHFLHMLESMDNFHLEKNIKQFEEIFEEVDFKNQCEQKRSLAQSMILELSLRNSATSIAAQKQRMNQFFKSMIQKVNQIKCPFY